MTPTKAELRRLAAVEAERDALLETFAKVCARLDIDTEAARKLPGKPSDVLIGAIDAEQDALKVALECERMRVVACGVVACSDTPKSAAVARDMLPAYRSASCDDVARRVDECISLRAERDALLAAMDHAREAVESVPVPRTWDFATSRHSWVTSQDFDDYRAAVLRVLGGK